MKSLGLSKHKNFCALILVLLCTKSKLQFLSLNYASEDNATYIECSNAVQLQGDPSSPVKVSWYRVNPAGDTKELSSSLKFQQGRIALTERSESGIYSCKLNGTANTVTSGNFTGENVTVGYITNPVIVVSTPLYRTSFKYA